MRRVTLACLIVLGSFTSSVPWEGRQIEEDRKLIDETTVRIELFQRNLDILKDLTDEISDPNSDTFRQFLTHDDVKELIGQSDDFIRRITAQIHSVASGLCDLTITVSPHNDIIYITSCLARIGKIFHVELNKYNKGSRSIYRASTLGDPERFTINLDVSLKSRIGRVKHLWDLPVELKWMATVEPEVSGYNGLDINPNIIRNNYGLDQYGEVATGEPQSSQASAEFQGQYWNPSDLVASQEHWGVPVNNVTNIIGEDKYKHSVNLNEASLHLQYLTSTEDLETWAFITPGTTLDFIDYTQTVLNTPEAPLVQAICYGAAEDQFSVSDLESSNTQFMVMASMGYTLLTASGEYGPNSDHECPQAAFSPDFPASSPYVTAVGATYLHNATNSHPHPQVAALYSGSGFSNFFQQPSWQESAVSAYLTCGTPLPSPAMYNSSGRAFPDLAAYGSKFQVKIGLRYFSISGTAAACPVVAAMAAYANALRLANRDPPLGCINPLLYAAGDVGTDITEGESRWCGDGFLAAPGWDPATGWGTPLADTFFSLLVGDSRDENRHS